MRPEVQVLPGPPPALTSTNAGRRVRSFVRRQCAGSRPLTWLPFLVMDVLLQGCSLARWSATRQRQRPPSRPSTTCCRPRRPHPCWQLITGRSRPPRSRVRRPSRLRAAHGTQTGARQARPPGSTVDERDAAPAGPCPPARRVGRSLASRPRAVTPSDPAGPGRSAFSPDRGSTRPTDAAAGRSPTTPVRAPRRPAIGAAGRAASMGGRSTATATCSTWSTAPGRWRWSWTGCGGSGGRASAAPSEQQRAMTLPAGRRCRGAPLGWCHAAPRPAR